MFKNSIHRKASTTQRLRAGLIFLTIALVLGSAGQTTPAVAAPQNQVVDGGKVNVNIKMLVIPPSDPICVGRRYTVEVIIVRTGTRTVELSPAVTDTEWVTVGRISYVMVEASVQDESIVTISPGRLITGYDPDSDTPQADFTFVAKKAGTTNLFFEALVPKRITGSKDAYLSETIPVKVVNCDYEVEARLTYYFSIGPGSFGFGTGLLSTQISRDDNENFTGNGTFSIVDGAIVPECEFSFTGWPIPVAITGSLDSNDNLQLEFAYSPTTAVTGGACKGFGVSASDSEWPSRLPKTVAFPSSGGSQAFSLDSPLGPVNVVFSVRPVAP